MCFCVQMNGCCGELLALRPTMAILCLLSVSSSNVYIPAKMAVLFIFTHCLTIWKSPFMIMSCGDSETVTTMKLVFNVLEGQTLSPYLWKRLCFLNHHIEISQDRALKIIPFLRFFFYILKQVLTELLSIEVEGLSWRTQSESGPGRYS